jgi:arginyl-tRNA synthetase
MIRNTLAELVRNAMLAAQNAGELPAFEIPPVEIARPPKPEMGDFSSSLPLKLAAVAKRAPLQIAQSIAKHFPAHAAIEKVETAAPGFVNLTLAPTWLAAQVDTINAAGAQFGNLNLGSGQRAQVEFVSANPTGPLHIGGARNAAIGDTLARILEAAGYRVEREYYINDAGSQIRHFGASIYARYAQTLGRDEPFPEDGYKGAYVMDLAREILDQHGARFLDLPRDEAIRALGRLGTDMVIAQVRATLARMNVHYDSWFSEKSLYDSGLFAQVMQKLIDAGLTYEHDGATWFAATKLGLDKDAVLIRSADVIPNPEERPTYLASDVAYVWNKLVGRGFDRAIYVWGAGHHGDVPRVYAAAKALGLDTSRMTILLYQNVQLTRGGQKVTMSKRGGTFVTTDEVLDEVGADAVRFMLITISANAPMDFDLQLAVQQSNENPVYYVQYMHARIAGILRNAAEQGIARTQADASLLQHPAELNLIKHMLKLEEIVELAAMKLEPHHLPHYALELGKAFSAFYDHCPVLPPKQTDPALTQARLALVVAAKTVLARALDLMGVTAPEKM